MLKLVKSKTSSGWVAQVNNISPDSANDWIAVVTNRARPG